MKLLLLTTLFIVSVSRTSGAFASRPSPLPVDGPASVSVSIGTKRTTTPRSSTTTSKKDDDNDEPCLSTIKVTTRKECEQACKDRQGPNANPRCEDFDWHRAACFLKMVEWVVLTTDCDENNPGGKGVERD